MLFADLYVQSINLDVANFRSARQNGDEEKKEQFLNHLIATLMYCSKHGLDITYAYKSVTYTLKRRDYAPVNRTILIEGREGFEYYTRPEPNRHTRRRIHFERMRAWKKLCSYDPRFNDEPNYGLHIY